jgi:hypothetical protein
MLLDQLFVRSGVVFKALMRTTHKAQAQAQHISPIPY